MDTSDVGKGGANQNGVCTPDGIIPMVDVTVDKDYYRRGYRPGAQHPRGGRRGLRQR
jgi:hypothetical protein